MITVYKKSKLPKDVELIRLNDSYFNKFTAALLNDNAKPIIKQIDRSELLNKYSFASRFDGTGLNIDKLSTGCKTALNIFYNADKVFDISECGENALELIYSFEKGKVYCDYPMIPFNLIRAEAFDGGKALVFNDYEELKKWWEYED
ncbi:protein of unknown function [Lachnospiraceae bacterium KH1T2]|nr:protein of unknown function [Lachnospiraceae bacterium KH1T2]